jgi:integrase
MDRQSLNLKSSLPQYIILVKRFFLKILRKFTLLQKLSHSCLKSKKANIACDKRVSSFQVLIAETERMLTTTNLLTSNQIADVLQINPYTINALVRGNQIPHTCVQTGIDTVVRFDPQLVAAWLRQGAAAAPTDKQEYLATLKATYQTCFPDALQSLKHLDTHYTTHKPAKGYSLSKVANKTHGFIYYVRYIENGKLIPSRWSTHTNDFTAATQFASENRERILTGYHSRKRGEHDPYIILGGYYKADSPLFAAAKRRGRVLCDKLRARYDNVINNDILPFLKILHIHDFADITPQIIIKLQDYLLKDRKPQTVNIILGSLSRAFEHLLLEGIVAENVFRQTPRLTVKEEDITKRGCHDLDAIQGKFDTPWEDTLSYLLCLLIYTTDMRNCEIERIRLQDIVTIDVCRFINILDSKTHNGIRMVPLHPFVYEQLVRYATEKNRKPSEYILTEHKCINTAIYTEAYTAMGKLLDMSPDDLNKEHISFYSGRHFWKTLMNEEGLGDAEEFFMGHTVSNDVKERYNHRDKRGREAICKKAEEVFAILDRRLFGTNQTKKL